jgi:hypothetical protein
VPSATLLATAASPVRVYSYVVARDFGFAPNPFHGWCTLATCKPRLRKYAQPGDWVVGTGTGTKGRAGSLVYAMRVEEALTFDQYWRDPRFRRKRPDLRASRKLAFGDNIYRRARDGSWCQLPSHHSFHDGRANPRNVATDTGVDRILAGRQFVYYGGSGPSIPRDLRKFGTDGEDLVIGGQNHKCRFSAELVAASVSWIESLPERGVVGRPGDW